MAHIIVPEAEAILDKEFKVLDKGFVRLIDYLGGDGRIVQAARVSYGQGTKTIREDKGLIDYLLSHQHTSPFEQVILTFHCKMPIFIARQWVRHRTARINEISGRYSVMADEFYVPAPDQVKYQSISNRQGRAEEDVPAELRQKVLDVLTREQKSAYENYGNLIDDGIARELARINLPLSLYTQWYWQIDLSNLFHFLKLRLDYHAQWEIRQYGKVIAEITKKVAPLAYQAFETHVLNAVTFSGKEIQALVLQLQGKAHELKGINKTEFEAKIQRILSTDKTVL
ncbi:MAG TPA: FAD-dependent thymidylate synthase [Candidatus Marinimicrobia bacterium]|nr:FAD-dependent thymidylate synthase [Candidatus Neomarinimicrobiota bacterium]